MIKKKKDSPPSWTYTHTAHRVRLHWWSAGATVSHDRPVARDAFVRKNRRPVRTFDLGPVRARRQLIQGL